jgi:NAD(P)-dependent dehydrogenase (short-subunit alcohol dehydrogenase family)
MTDRNESLGTPHRRVLIVGASRGLGEALAETYVARGAFVVGTVRSDAPTPLHAFAQTHPDAVAIEQADVTVPGQLTALRERLDGRTVGLLLVVAGVSLAPADAIGADMEAHDFHQVMDTNVLGVMKAVETLQDVVSPDGTIAVMSSGQGSLTNNITGGNEVYRASKAALNQMMRSFAARHGDDPRTLLLLAPGWIRTAMGGAGAPFEVGDAIPPLVDTIDAQHHRGGLQYLDRFGQTVPW